MRFPTNHGYLCSKLPNWFSRISESYANGDWKQVLSHYRELTREAGSQLIDPLVLPQILKACSNLSYGVGKSLHASLIKLGFDSFSSIANSAMDFYVKCGDLNSALSVFRDMTIRDSVSWNVVVFGHLDQDALVEGLSWFGNAKAAGFVPNASTLVLAVHACRRIGATYVGLQLHCYIIIGGFWSTISVQNSLLSMYAECNLVCAVRLFDQMLNRDLITWSTMIKGYIQQDEPQIGLQLFKVMVFEVGVVPDAVIMVSVLKACVILENLFMGKLVHGMVIRRGLDYDLFVRNSLIDVYSKSHDDISAFQVFNEMHETNIVSWNTIMSGFILNGKHTEALSLFRSMEKEGHVIDEVTFVNIIQTCKSLVHPWHCKSVHCRVIRCGYELNLVVVNTLLDAYAKCHLADYAWHVFDGMKERDTISWNTMIAGFAYCGMPVEAISVFQEMGITQEETHSTTIISLFDACSVFVELRLSNAAHGLAVRRGFMSEVAVGTALVDMYAKCGAIDFAREVFDDICHKNVASYSAMIAAYGMNGLPHEALTLLEEMKFHGLEPNEVTSLSILSACSHGGFVAEGLSFFESMVQEHGIQPSLKHYSSVVDMLGRAGKLDCAIKFVEKISESVTCGASIWGALLSACRRYGNSKLGEGVVSHVLDLEPSNSAGYLIASSMFAASGLWSDAAKMRRMVKERGVKVNPGYSLVHIGNMAYRFLAGNASRQSAEDTYVLVEHLHNCMKLEEDYDFFLN